MIKTIPLNKLVPSPRNVRKHADPAADALAGTGRATDGRPQGDIRLPDGAAPGQQSCAGLSASRPGLGLENDRRAGSNLTHPPLSDTKSLRDDRRRRP